MENQTLNKLTDDILPTALKEIQKQLIAQADLHDITMEELLADYSKRDQKKYREYVEKNYKELMNSDKKYQEFIDEYFPDYDYAKVNRLLQIRTDIFDIFAREMIDKDANKVFNDRLEDILQRTYSSNSQALARILSIDVPNKLSQSELDNILNYPWSGKTFSNRLWGNVSKLEQNLSNSIVKSISSGQGVLDALKTMRNDPEICDMFKQESSKYKRAIENLVRTEYASFAQQGIARSYKATNIEEYDVLTSEDEKVCSICGGKANSNPYKLSDAIIGENRAPFHGRCRCTDIPHMPNLSSSIDEEYEAMFGDLLDEFANDQFGIKLNNSKHKDEKFTNREYSIVNDKILESLQSESDEWFNSLGTIGEESVKKYTGSFYKSMNYLLRNPPKEVGFLDEITYSQIDDFSKALSQFKLNDNIITYRGISQAEYNEILNNSVFKDFKSTSIKMKVAKNFKEDSSEHKLVTFKIPKGTNGAYVGNHSMVDLEREFTLNYGTKYKVKENKEGLEVTIIGRW